MSNCAIQPMLERYLDGELDAEGRAAVERHLKECAACGRELNELRGMSSLFANASYPPFLPIMRQRLHQRVELTMERGLLRIAWMLSGVAASVLIVGSAWLLQTGYQTQEAAAPPPWVAVAAASDRTATPATVTPAAEWYLADASSSRGDEMP